MIFFPLQSLPFPSNFFHLLKSTLALALSRLGRTELLELRLRRARCSPGSAGFNPVDRANRLRMSVRDTTPVSRPDRWAPGNAAAGTDGKLWPGNGDDGGPEAAPGAETKTVDEARGEISVGVIDGVAPPLVFECDWLGVRSGVAGALGEGDANSTSHMRWLWVATSLATVWARVE